MNFHNAFVGQIVRHKELPQLGWIKGVTIHDDGLTPMLLVHWDDDTIKAEYASAIQESIEGTYENVIYERHYNDRI